MVQKIMQKITPFQAQKPLSPAPRIMNLGSWGRFQVSPPPQSAIDDYHRCSGGDKLFLKTCCHCQTAFKTNRENQEFCRPGHRTYNNRLKRLRLIDWFETHGLTYDQATDLIEKKGLSVLVKTMLQTGWQWTGREWVQKA